MAKVVSVHSFRGGTGKSNSSANIAAALARDGYRVGVVDTDIASPGVHILFGLDESDLGLCLNDYLRGECAVEDVAYDVTHVLGDARTAGSAIYLIPSSIHTGEILRVLKEGYDVSLLNDGFRELTRTLNLDYLFIDTHPGLNEETLLSIAISDVLILLMRPDRQDFQGTAVTASVADQLEVPLVLMLVNKVLAEIDKDELARHVEQTYGHEVAGVLPLSEDVVRLASGGLFCLEMPDHPFSQAIGDVASRLTR